MSSRREILVYSSISHIFPKGLIFPRVFGTTILNLGAMLCQFFFCLVHLPRNVSLKDNTSPKEPRIFDQMKANIVNSFEMHPPWILFEPGGECYSLGHSPRPFLAIGTTARSMAGLTRQGRILLAHNLSTFQVSNNTGCACALVQP